MTMKTTLFLRAPNDFFPGQVDESLPPTSSFSTEDAPSVVYYKTMFSCSTLVEDSYQLWFLYATDECLETLPLATRQTILAELKFQEIAPHMKSMRAEDMPQVDALPIRPTPEIIDVLRALDSFGNPIVQHKSVQFRLTDAGWDVADAIDAIHEAIAAHVIELTPNGGLKRI